MKKLIALILSLCMLVGVLPAMAETASKTVPADLNELIDRILSDIESAVIRVDMADAKAKSDAKNPDAYKGTVFAVMETVLTSIAEAMEKEEKAEAADVKKVVDLLSSLKTQENVNEQELEVMSSMIVLGIMANAEERAEQEAMDVTSKIAVVNFLVKTVFDTAQENEGLVAAVKATDSKLFDMLLQSNSRIQEYVEKAGAVDTVNEEVDQEPYAKFEAEVQKVDEYLNGLEGPKNSALDMLHLLHAVMDDIHSTINGHAYDDVPPADGFSLVGEMLNDLGNAVLKIDLDNVKANAKENFNTNGGVYAVLEKIIKYIQDDAAVEKKETDEALAKILEMIDKLDQADVTEEEAETVFALLLTGLAAAEEEAAVAAATDLESDFRRASNIMKAAYDTMMENEMITDAVKATESRLPEMLQETNNRLNKHLEKTGTLHLVKDADEAPFVAFEAELAKVRDHLQALESPARNKALGLLDLLHEFVDDVHETLDGHTHEDTAKKTATFNSGAAFGMNMDDVIAVLGRTGYEIDNEHTLGPVAFTELEYDHVTVDGKNADEHYLFVGNELVAIRICFEHGLLTFDQAREDLTALYGDFQDLDLTALANGIYAVDDDGSLKGRAAGIVVGDMMVVITEDEDEVEVTYVDLTAAYILAA